MAEFFHMGGYALYVWGSFGATAALMIAEPLLIARRRRLALQRAARLVRVKTQQQEVME